MYSNFRIYIQLVRELIREAGVAKGFQPGRGRDFLGIKVFQELGTNIKEKDFKKKYNTQEKGLKLKKKGQNSQSSRPTGGGGSCPLALPPCGRPLEKFVQSSLVETYVKHPTRISPISYSKLQIFLFLIHS